MSVIPLFIVIATIAVPIYFSARPRPKQALRKLQLTMAVLALLWAILCLQVYPRYVVPE